MNVKEQSTSKINSTYQNFKHYFKEYCQSTSIHGFKYLCDDQKRLKCERIWWLISFLFSLSLCVMLILQIYKKWDHSPVIVSFATKETPIWQIPFPVVTICPETKAVPTKFNYKKYLNMKINNQNLSNDEETKFGLISFLCSYNENINIDCNFTGNSEDILSFYEEVQPDFYNMISNCKFMGKSVNCSEVFIPILTDDGICYSFNILDREDIYNNTVQYKNFQSAPRTNWTLEHGYHIREGRYPYPRRSLFAGVLFALEAKLTVREEELDYVCGSSIQGFKVDITHPSRIPRPKFQHSRIPLNQAVMITLLLDMISTSDPVKNYHPRRRNCYMPFERPLKYFQIYTQQNCKLECLTNYTLNKCGCVSFYMPRASSETRICNGNDYHCVYLAEMDMLNASIDGHLLKLKGLQTNTKCDCLPICSKMNYILQSSQLSWNWKEEFSNHTEGKHMSMIQIYFKDNQFITSERNELFGPIDFMANLGGLLGLFIGFSLLSLIEIIYYLTLKLYANFKLFGRKNWSGKIQDK